MLSKASSLWYADAPNPLAVLRANHDPDPEAALALAKQLHDDCDVRPIMVGTLAGCAGPEAGQVYIGCYPGVTVLCSAQAARIRPTEIPELLVRPLASEHTYLVSFDAGHGWGAFAHWERGELRRSFSSTRVNILEDEGLPLVWERPYWAGEHPVQWRAGELPDPQTLPFDPPDFADTANNEWLGFHYRAPAADGALVPGDVPICGFTLYPKGHAPEPVGQAPADGEAHDQRRRGFFGWLRGHDRVL
ncbi:hypothetical protein OHA40_19305 [Nocardia sp. NBC_00508]|uniref:DUF6928 family protein n=1 Tax=Nocardia sp. NBC_00508 TaxID=2975992 RepID=UPI002E817BC0|nr:hypothetical protein [Nocardia sp. NBC_00508]WUD63887.1 hypothetical protein OHA40_19305 [Nocardia sp. NBC_00508]